MHTGLLGFGTGDDVRMILPTWYWNEDRGMVDSAGEILESTVQCCKRDKFTTVHLNIATDKVMGKIGGGGGYKT